MLANEYIEMSFHNFPGYSERDYYKTIGKNNDHRFIKVNQYMPFYNFDEFYIKGVGLFEAKMNKEKSKEYELYKNVIYSLSKKDFNETVMSTKIKMLYRNNNKEYNYKLNISSGIRKDEQVKALYNWFESERKSMIFDKEMSFEAGVQMKGNMSFRGNKVYFNLFIKNPTKQNIEMVGFKQLSLNTISKAIQVKIVGENSRYIYINLDEKYQTNNGDDILKINAGKEVNLEFVYDVEDVFNILNNKDNMDNFKVMLSSKGGWEMYMVVRNSFIYPDSISGRFEYYTLRESIDISPLKKFK